MLVTDSIAGRTVTFRREPGEGPTLVFIHGAGSNYRLHDRLVDALPGRERIAINLPARAGTDGPPLDAVEPMAVFLGTLLDALVEGPYVPVGFSLGGAVAMEHALGSPEGLVGLVLLATGAKLRVNPALVQLVEATRAAGGELPAMPAAAFEDTTDPSVIEEEAELRRLTPIETAASDWRACDSFDRMTAIERIDVPTLVLGGSDDLMAPPKFSEFLSRAIPRSELHVLKGARHTMAMERPEEIARLIDSFVSRP